MYLQRNKYVIGLCFDAGPVRTKAQKVQHEGQDGVLQMSYSFENVLHDKPSHTAEAYNLGAISGIPAHIKREFCIILLACSLELQTVQLHQILPGRIARIQWYFHLFLRFNSIHCTSNFRVFQHQNIVML